MNDERALTPQERKKSKVFFALVISGLLLTVAARVFFYPVSGMSPSAEELTINLYLAVFSCAQILLLVALWKYSLFSKLANALMALLPLGMLVHDIYKLLIVG